MDFKNLTDSELAHIMVNYISRVDHLRKLVANYIDHRDTNISADEIRDLYKQLKHELREDADYLGLVRNYNGSCLYMRAFRPSIREASAFGFTIPANRQINHQFYSAVADAHYKLTKYHSLEEWGELI